MYKYQAIFSRETHNKEKIPGRCAFVISLSFHQAEFPQITSQENTLDLHKFSAVLRRLNFAFEEIDIILADTLNKHNASIFFPEDDPEKKSLALGDAWLESAYFRETIYFFKKSSIKRWNELALHHNLKYAQLIIEELYKKNKVFSSIVDSVRADFVAFLCRKRKKILENNKSTSLFNSNFDVNKAYENSLTYILEECAVTITFRLNKYANLFHIGKVNDAVAWSAKNFINLNVEQNDIIKSINDNPLKIFTVLKFKSLQNSVASDKNKSNEKNNLFCGTIFKKNVISRRKTIHNIPKEEKSDFLKRKISVC